MKVLSGVLAEIESSQGVIGPLIEHPANPSMFCTPIIPSNLTKDCGVSVPEERLIEVSIVGKSSFADVNSEYYVHI
jgi:hypothetical protein